MTEQERADKIAEVKARLAQMDQEDAIESVGQNVEDGVVSGAKHGVKLWDAQRGGLQMALLEAMGKGGLLTSREKDAATHPLSNTELAPGYSEVMRRAGVPEGYAFSDVAPAPIRAFYARPGEGSWWRPEKGGMLDPTLRGGIGMAADVALDPLTWESMGTSAASKAITTQSARHAARGNLGKTWADFAKNRAAKMGLPKGVSPRELADGLHSLLSTVGAPTRNAAETVGHKMYTSAMKPLDRTAVEVGKQPYSLLAKEKGVRGGWGSMEEQLRTLRDDSGALARGTADELESLDPFTPGQLPPGAYPGTRPPAPTGGTDMAAAMEKAQPALRRLDNRPIVGDLQKALAIELEKLGALGRVPRQVAMQNKSDLYRALPGNAWDLESRVSPGGGVRKMAARGIKEEVTKLSPAAQGNARASRLAMELDPQMEEWGRHLDVENDISRLARKEANRPGLTRGEGYQMTSVGALGGPTAGLESVLAKKSVDAALGTPVRTWGGWALDRYANSTPKIPFTDVRVLPKGAPASFMDGSLRQNVILDILRQQQAADQGGSP